MKHRNTHYWNWFIFFGLVAGVIFFAHSHTIDSESTWLLVTGLLGLILGANWVNGGKLSRPYDLLIGIIFAAVGVLGVLQAFNVHVIASNTGVFAHYVNSSHIFGLSLDVLPSLVHAALGLSSLNHGIKND